MRNHEVRVEDGQLVCPNCGEGYLHSQEVFVFHDAIGTGKVAVTAVKTDNKTIQSISPHELSGNPSRDRQGIKIAFTCEHCHDFSSNSRPDDRYYLNMAQHKGVTLMFWDNQYGHDA